MQVRILPRTLRFKQPAGTSRGVYRTRRVWYVVVTYDQEGRTAFGIGECAPLHDLSCDYDDRYEERLARCCRALEANDSLDADALRPCPSILFGLETALLSARASLRGDFLDLFPGTPFARGEAGIPINGLVWMGNAEQMMKRMDEKLAAGFSCIKLKIGAIDWESELDMIRRLRCRYSPADVEIRVDANGAFRPEEALGRLEQLARYGLHSIEQPIRQGQWAEMARLCRATPLPIALDEELIGVHDLGRKRALLDEIAPHYLVLKPTLHGGLHGSEEWIREATARGIPYWVTSALESNVGLNALARWHASLQPAPGSPRHQGLGTGGLFEQNFTHTRLSLEGEHLWNLPSDERAFLDELARLRRAWDAPTPTLPLRTSGSTGTPHTLQAEKARMAESARTTCHVLGLRPGHTALLCMPLRYVAGTMQAVRSYVGELKLVAVAPCAHPLQALRHAPHFAAMTPMQAWESLRRPRERRLLRAIRVLLLGGGALPPRLEAALRDFPHAVYCSYGMTETLTHIALRRVNGPRAEAGYSPLPRVRIATDADGCLVVSCPACEGELHTNDQAEMLPDGTFRILGRRDNVVCSGGIKLQTEELERRIGLDGHVLLTSVPDDRLGQALVMLCEPPVTPLAAREACRQRLGRYEQPRHYLAVPALPRTDTGKPARAQASELARNATAHETPS